MRQPINAREWLHTVAFGEAALGSLLAREPEFAREVLDDLDDAQGINGHREEMSDMVYEILVCQGGLCVGDEPLPFVEAMIKQVNALRALCVSAGLLVEGDRETDPLPLLRMFLPV